MPVAGLQVRGYLVSTGVLCPPSRHDPTHAGVEVEGAVTDRPASQSTLESPSIGYTLQDVPGESAVPRVDDRLRVRSTVPRCSSHTKVSVPGTAGQAAITAGG